MIKFILHIPVHNIVSQHFKLKKKKCLPQVTSSRKISRLKLYIFKRPDISFIASYINETSSLRHRVQASCTVHSASNAHVVTSITHRRTRVYYSFNTAVRSQCAWKHSAREAQDDSASIIHETKGVEYIWLSWWTRSRDFNVLLKSRFIRETSTSTSGAVLANGLVLWYSRPRSTVRRYVFQILASFVYFILYFSSFE